MTLSVWSIATIAFIHDWEIDRFLDRRDDTFGFLIALSPTRWPNLDDAIRSIRRARREMPIIAYADGSDDWASLAVRAIQCGADHLALHGFDDLRRVVARALNDVALAPACGATLRLVLPRIPRPAHPIIEYCILHAPKALSVLDVAHQVGVTPRSVNRQLHALGLPTIAATISWCRLFVAAYLISHEQQRVDHVALILGYGSGSALRNMLRRYTQRTALAFRDPEAVYRLAELYGAPTRGIGLFA